jgi:hypothetical protein
MDTALPRCPLLITKRRLLAHQVSLFGDHPHGRVLDADTGRYVQSLRRRSVITSIWSLLEPMKCGPQQIKGVIKQKRAPRFPGALRQLLMSFLRQCRPLLKQATDRGCVQTVVPGNARFGFASTYPCQNFVPLSVTKFWRSAKLYSRCLRAFATLPGPSEN